MQYNVLIGKGVLESDKELFFGPLNQFDKFVVLPEETRLPQLLRFLGVFKSSSDAIRNGWNKDIEPGFSEIKIGKGQNFKWICVLKILE